jgi:hypothetical protein
MASATHCVPSAPFRYNVPKPSIGIFTPLFSVTILMAGALATVSAAQSREPLMPAKKLAAVNPAAPFKKSRRLSPFVFFVSTLLKLIFSKVRKF